MARQKIQLADQGWRPGMKVDRRKLIASLRWLAKQHLAEATPPDILQNPAGIEHVKTYIKFLQERIRQADDKEEKKKLRKQLKSFKEGELDNNASKIAKLMVDNVVPKTPRRQSTIFDQIQDDKLNKNLGLGIGLETLAEQQVFNALINTYNETGETQGRISTDELCQRAGLEKRVDREGKLRYSGQAKLEVLKAARELRTRAFNFLYRKKPNERSDRGRTGL